MIRLLLIGACVLLSGCISQYSISEREMESYLNREIGLEIKDKSGPLGARLSVNQVEVTLGHKPDTMAVKATSLAELKTPLVPLRATVTATFEAKPWYDKNAHGVYLRGLELVSLESSPPELKQLLTGVTPELMRAVRTYLESQPVYVLDTRDKAQGKLAEMTEKITVKPGKLVLEFN
ncbi:DUF1439 domain-containing protein [Shewanella sp. JM162201]|uniref:DUF1439 domain-containing protein n=1 Tax=Shewanella jiangmenensis TaxID=2837387 RepID=A0ABS5V9H9_9GAMM|nr:DUF1439 domain-containing protein [Shewanella jiangmenensis]MBT1446396.1 DUF1439 domain-containing protein [Shewanella jiangmenensis]